jgi:hypothetical protein
MKGSFAVRQIILTLACTRMGLGADAARIGPPQNPSLLSTLATIWQSGMLGPRPAPKGRVRQLTWEKLQMRVGQPGKGVSPEERSVITYDDAQNEIERMDENLIVGGRCTTKSTWQKGRITSQNHSCSGSRGTTNVWWTKWTYDPWDESRRFIHTTRAASHDIFIITIPKDA